MSLSIPALTTDCFFISVFLSVVIGLCEVDLSLNADDVKVTVENITDTSAVLAWKLKHAPQQSTLDCYRFTFKILSEKINAESEIVVEPNTACSLQGFLLRCCLSEVTSLTPSTSYRVIIYIDNSSNVIRSDEVLFRTLPERDLEWWVTYIGVPAAGCLLVTVVVIIIIARCCKCCCWHKKKKHQQSNQQSPRSSSSSRQVLRSESVAARQWVRDTFQGIELDSPSTTYDQPDVPNLPASDPPAYQAVNVFPSSRGTLPNLKKTTTPGENCRTNERPTLANTPTSKFSYVNTEITLNTLPTEKHGKKISYVNQHYTPSLPVKAEGQEKRQQGPCQQQQQKQQQNPAQYINTEDLDKLLGSSRKMFPML